MHDYCVCTLVVVAIAEDDDSLLAGLIDLSVDLALLTSKLELGCYGGRMSRGYICVVPLLYQVVSSLSWTLTC